MFPQNPLLNNPPKRKPATSSMRAPALMLPIFKSPILLYRWGLGGLFGHRFLLLTHVGRRSGKVRRTILAVLKFDHKTHEIMAISAWSASDWYKNIQASPALEVQMGSVRYAPIHRALTPEEIAELFEEYRRIHPLFTRVICRIPGWKWDSTHDEFLGLARTLRGIAFLPQDPNVLVQRTRFAWETAVTMSLRKAAARDESTVWVPCCLSPEVLALLALWCIAVWAGKD